MASEDKIKSISAFFFFSEPEPTGNAVIIHTLSYISTRFNLVIYTNDAGFLQKQLPGTIIISLADIKLSKIRVMGMLSYCKKIARVLNSDQSDAIFLGHNFSPIALWLKKPCFHYVYQMHEMLGLDKLKGFEKVLQSVTEYFIVKGIRAGKANFVVSEPIMHYLRLHKSHNNYLTPHCVNLEKFSAPLIHSIHLNIKRKRDLGYFVVCYTGCVSEKRGLKLMLESLYISLQRDPNILFVIAGSDSEDSASIIKFFTDKQFADNILCMGKIEYDYIPGVLALSDVCLSFLEDNPVYRMSPPQKVVEYMASGKPVIANMIHTHSILITNEFDGYLTEFNPSAVAEKILYLKANPAVYDLMSRNVLKTAEKFDTSRVYSEIESVIKGLL
jgi:glycosyltransferase involved in cell wall biosynthesis